MFKKFGNILLLSAIIMLMPTIAMAAGEQPASTINYADVGYVAFAALMVFFMTPALGFFYGGMVRKKNLLNTIMMSFIATGLIAVQWVLWGYSLSFGPDISGIIGNLQWAGFNGVGLTPFADYTPTIPHMEFALFQMMFAVITPAIISGSIAERMNFSAYAIFIVLWATFVYDPLCHMVWGIGGVIRNLGALDFAGGTVIHISSGVSGLVASYIVGKRYGFGQASFVPNNLPYVLLGGAVLWIGWFGFNSGCALGANELMVLAFTNTGVASAAAVVTWAIMDKIVFGKCTLMGVVTSALAGLVGITPAAGFVEIWAALAIGIIVSIVCFVSVTYVKKAMGYDDSLDAFGVHGVGGICGAILTGVFSTTAVNEAGANGLLYGNPHQVLIQIIGVVVSICVSAIVTTILLKVIGIFIKLRVSKSVEKAGLDYSQHGESPYCHL